MDARAAPTQPGTNPGGKLNNALSDFALSFVKKELQQLARECDDNLGRNYVPRLRALLREVDRERDAFEHEKQQLVKGLRAKLELLQVDDDAVDDVVAQLHAMGPKYLGAIPSASTLTIRPPTPTMSPTMSPSRENNYFSTVLSADARLNGLAAAPQSPIRERSAPGLLHHSSPAVAHGSPLAITSIDRQVQYQVIGESSLAIKSPKRPRVEGRSNSGTLPKRQKVVSEKRKGFFVIRCDRPGCSSGYFREPPLVYNRAMKHFQKHGEIGPDDGELTNDYIFDKFACQIEGSDLASKYWIKEHLGTVPHTFIPGKTPRIRAAPDDNPELSVDHEEVNEDFVLSDKTQGSIHARQSDDESEPEKPRRTPRSVPRPDYAELVANKDPCNGSDADSEKTSQTTKASRASSRKRKVMRLSGTASPTTSKIATPLVSTVKTVGIMELNKYVSTSPLDEKDLGSTNLDPLATLPNSGPGDQPLARHPDNNTAVHHEAYLDRLSLTVQTDRDRMRSFRKQRVDIYGDVLSQTHRSSKPESVESSL
ncbi:Uu.00g120780.m01.CDS01 [Anthostomella pinea]|uniref:Uu.00g120780.m01.CDS01 n=1 Tax=Anthostomella pinea TaxID=933095 RepID=A0AAI8VGT2_9PEZI|nr:Uu.00g120780.m01.CDS01 [Anthostomella pinea]